MAFERTKSAELWPRLEANPSLPLAFRIANAFGLTVEEVFDKTDV